MNDFDQLPKELRHWVCGAVLPWSPYSVQKAFRKAIQRTGDIQLALGELDRIQAALVDKDTPYRLTD